MNNNMRNFLETDLYGLTAAEFSNGRSNVEVVKDMLSAGIKVIQYREKNKKSGSMYRECLEIRQLTAKAGATFIVNDFIDLALAVKADGVHIGQDDMPAQIVRSLVGDMIIGLSTHSPEQAQAALFAGVDYIGVGPIYRTKTKKDVCSPVGLEYLRYVAKEIELPYVAIGGIKENNIKEVKDNGATIIAMVTEMVGAPKISEKIHSIRKILGA